MGNNYLILEMKENVEGLKVDLKEVKYDGKVLKEEIRALGVEMKHDLREMNDSLHTAIGTQPGK